MSSIIHERSQRTATKKHLCDYCLLHIHPKTKYSVTTINSEGRIYDWKSHKHCDILVEKLQMFESAGEEGLTSDYFREFIFDNWLKDYEKANGKFPNRSYYPNFPEILESVLERYDIPKNK